MAGKIHIETGVDEGAQMSCHQNASLHGAPNGLVVSIDTEACYPDHMITEAQMADYLREALAPLQAQGWNFHIAIGVDESNGPVVKHLGDSLLEIDGETLDIDTLASNLVFNNGGGELADIIGDYSDSHCEYLGDSLWHFENNDCATDDAIRNKICEILYEAHPEVIDKIVRTYHNGS